MRVVKYRLTCLLLLVVCQAAVSNHTVSAGFHSAATARNLILLIGDGMGLSQVSAGLYYNGKHLNLERCPVTGLIETYSASHLTTDSGAGATAFACGCKTYNTAIGLDAKRNPCRSILESAEAQGLATGLVVTCSLTHATPGSFIAHAEDRGEVEKIAGFYPNSGLDLFIGGGMKQFVQRGDGRNLCADMEAQGWKISDYKGAPLRELKPDPAHPFGWFSAMEEPVAVTEGRKYLPEAASLAPVFLQKRSEKGFFLMVEGSQIDWACHGNDGPRAVAEMLDFDAAIGAALRFAEADGHTLVIITADHETGGMSLGQGAAADSLDIKFNTKRHSPSLVPVFAFGPGAEAFGGVYDNTDIYGKMMAALGLSQ